MRNLKIQTQLIDKFRKDHNMTVKEFCKYCGISKYIY